MTGGYPLSSRVLSALLRVIIGLGGGLVVAALMAITGSVLVSLVASLAHLQLSSDIIFRTFNFLSIGLGAAYTGRYVGRAGWLMGGLLAFLYYCLLTWWVEGSLQFLTQANPEWLGQIGIAVAVGILGGIVGVNLSNDH